MKKCISIKVFGLVQGVWFRKSAMNKAIELGLYGIAKNEKDGTVYIEAEGEPDKLDTFSLWCKIGPPRAMVSHLIITEISLHHFTDFKTG